jgi:TM2 domain-containing membrane protein YozV
MHPRLHSVPRFQDLLVRRPEDDPYVFPSIFNNDTWRARRLSTKKLKLLKAVDETLRPMLAQGEKVHFVSWGNRISFWESYLLGWIAYALTRQAIVLTDSRMLLVHIDRKFRPRIFRSQVKYLAIDTLAWPLLGGMKLKLRRKKTHRFSYVPRADRVQMREFIRRKKMEFRGYAADRSDIQDLCPHCHKPVVGSPPTCLPCRVGFKSPTKAALLSLLFPGLGDLYLGHKVHGIVEILFAALIWFGFLLPQPESTTSLTVMLIGAAILFVFMHGFDALATRHIGRKGLYPAEAPEQVPQARAA